MILGCVSDMILRRESDTILRCESDTILGCVSDMILRYEYQYITCFYLFLEQQIGECLSTLKMFLSIWLIICYI